MNDLSKGEIDISHSAEYDAYIKKRKYANIAFIYYIIHRGNIIYIGCTCRPYSRERGHHSTLVKRGITTYVIRVIGPFGLALATKIEDAEISRHANGKKLLNKNSKKNNYDKAFCIENFGRKPLSFLRKGGKVKKMVG